jgi:membrane-associated protease RseP (regulator of RpoE activity)
MTRFMKAMLATAAFGIAATPALAAPPPIKEVTPIKLFPKPGLPPIQTLPPQFPFPFPQPKPLPLPLPLPQPQPLPLPQPAPQWKLGVRISGNPAGGLYIHEVFANSPAELAGLQAGMVLLTVDGVLYNDPAAARDKVMFKSGDTIDLVYSDGTGFYQVTAQLSTVMMMLKAPGGMAEQKAIPQLKNLKRVQVLDPRKK